MLDYAPTMGAPTGVVFFDCGRVLSENLGPGAARTLRVITGKDE